MTRTWSALEFVADAVLSWAENQSECPACEVIDGEHESGCVFGTLRGVLFGTPAVQPDALLRDPDPGFEKPDDEREDDCGLEPDAPLPRCNCVVARGGPGSVNKYGPHHSYECPMHKAGGLLPDGAQPQP